MGSTLCHTASPVRTGQAWHLLPHPEVLGRQAHALLLLSNGRRSLHELSCLMGCDVTPLVAHLQQSGLLQWAPQEPVDAGAEH